MTKITFRISSIVFSLLIILNLSACQGNTKVEATESPVPTQTQENTATPLPDNWVSTGLGTIIPYPESDNIEISEDNAEYFSATISNYEQSQFDKYVSMCKSYGFNIDSDYSTWYYTAFNSNDFNIDIFYNDSNKEMSIDLSAPPELDTIYWPNNEMVKRLPVPQATTGYIECDSSTRLEAYLGESSKAVFNDYINKCMENGFTVDYYRDEATFSAYDEEGYYLRLERISSAIFSIIIHAPEEDETTSSQAPTSSPITTSEEHTEPIKDSVREEVKEFLESYEAFYDEYIEFMDKYYTTDNASLTMLADYSKMLIKYEDFNKKYDELDDGTFTEAEEKLYIDTQLRVNNKLLKAMENWN